MKSAILFTFAATAGLASAQSISAGCTDSLKALLTNSDAACLNPSALLSFFVGNAQSVPDTVNNWLNGLCAVGTCSNDTLAAVVANVTMGCAADLGSGVGSTVTEIVQEVYPTVRSIMCLKDDASNKLCVTETLTNLETLVGKLSFSDFNLGTAFTDFQKVLTGAANLACTSCVKAAFRLAAPLPIVQQFPQAEQQAALQVDAICGANFIENSASDSDSQDGVTQTATTEAFTTKTNGALAFSANRMVGAMVFLLAAFTLLVKEVHRPVDNEQADQKRLEDEIAASRLARQRRSRGLGPAGKTNSLDLSRNTEYASALRSEDKTSTDDHSKSLADRQASQAEALNKLMGPASQPPAKEQPTIAPSRPEPMSLAAFIGGKATGPRLNRHAPQQDAHDPTQFVQRTRIDAPHPIFGRGGIGGIGGVAMPGMAKPSPPSAPREPEQTPAWSRPGRTPEPRPRDRRLSTPSPEKPDSPPTSPQRAGVRERTMSTPTGVSIGRNNPIVAPQPTRTPSSTGGTQTKPSYSTPSHANSSPTTSRPFTPRQQPSPSPVPKSPVVTPSLTRPIQPDPRSSPQGPQISISQSPSLAFLRPPTQKDPTPSLSRLQGRGFVQNMVKVSSQLDSPSPPPGPDKNRPPSGRKSSVLDRWPAASSPPPSPTASPMRRSRTVESPAPAAPSVVRSEPLAKSYSDTGKPAAMTGGAGHTAVVIQPKGVGVDEHGFKREDDPSPRPSKGSALSDPAKPLIHPTKDRAKKPKKNRASGSENGHSNSSQPLSANPALSTSFSSSPSNNTIPVGPSSPRYTGIPWWRRHDPWRPLQSLPATSFKQDPPMTNVSAFTAGRALPGMAGTHSTAPLKSASRATERLAGIIWGQWNGGTQSTSRHDPAAGGILPQTRLHAGRPTAMDVAQALADLPSAPSPSSEPPVDDQPSELPPARLRNMMPPGTQAEKRKSSYERYSMFLPPLKEEATPDPTPVSTLTRAVGRNAFDQPGFDLADLDLKLSGRDEDVVEEPAVTAQAEVEDQVVHFTHIDEPLPRVDASRLINYVAPSPSADLQTIQVDVMAITGSTAVPLALTHIFYDTEILAIIHRSKSSSTGLINSTVWSWQGRSSNMGSKESAKLGELAKRYGTSILSEPIELVQCLGGTLAIRQFTPLQGSRAHWTNENTAMHVVRSMDGVYDFLVFLREYSRSISSSIIIDQVDIDIKNICSGFSYCASILSTMFVWHGCGSTPAEREAAIDYARTLTSSPDDIVVLIENESGDDEMFWMVLGDEADYAKADYWKWRPTKGATPRIWSVDAGRKDTILPVHSIHQEQSAPSCVFIMDCVFEFFVLVPPAARGKRRDIRLALSVAMDAANRLAVARPYTPTVHTVILPSQLPVDLKIQFRGLEEAFMNETDVPEHMNVLSSQDAQTHLRTSSWPRPQLKDRTMLPLGLDDTHVS
ncbi:hypothetical protein C8R46DRAFT_1023578 [Mycena filopes]|nr:hypothetical protein C8R46DRAFT_1023578 [Mycena filopes]